MLRRSIFVVAVLFLAGTFMPLRSFAIDINFCTTWKSKFVDAGHGEDTYTSTSWVYRTAKYAHYEVRLQSTDALVASGILSSSGCTGNISLSSNTAYKFRQATKVERTGNRRIYVEVQDASGFGANYTWLNSYITTGTISDTIELEPNWEGSGARISVVAAQVLNWYSTLEYPYGTQTYIWPDDDHSTSYNSGANIAIDTEWNHMSGYPNYGMDMSQYKFIVGHELGHRQASATGGPLTGSYAYENTSIAKCNCSHFPDDYDDACFQSQEHIGTAEKEAWAFFYAAALFNNRATNCGMSYWRAMYTGSTPGTATLDSTPPVTVDCADNPIWQASLCTGTDKGVLQDWVGYFWDLWTVGDDKFEVDELTDIWDATYGSSTTGELWEDLLDSTETIYGSTSDEYIFFGMLGYYDGVIS